MQHIFWGALIIAIGLYFGQSVFLGHFSVLNVIFDGLGVYWLSRGVLGQLRKLRESRGPAV